MMNTSSGVVGAQMPRNSACTRPPIRWEFEGCFSMVITIRGASVVRRRMRSG